jgi:hypothetical protein
MSRSLLIFGLCLPLAVLMGFMLSDPLVSKNMMVIGGLAALLFIPAALNLHHSMLIWTSMMYMTAFFVKGQPQMWMLLAAVSFTISILSRPLRQVRLQPLWTNGLAASLIFLAMVSIGTALYRGGFGMRSFGSDVYGGKRYIFVWVAVVGFFALTMQPISMNRLKRDLGLFALGPVTAAFSNIAYMLGPYFYFLFFLFPVNMALGQAAADMSPGFEGLKRLNGFGPASVGITCFCLMRWGLRGLLSLRHPWRAAIVLIAMGFGLLSGFRSNLALCLLLCLVQFFTEGLHRTRYAIGFISLGVVCLGFLSVFSEKLPMTAQRALSFLPIRVDPTATLDARASTLWRLEMWSVLSAEIPKYFWIGKGYAIDPTDLYIAGESMARGFAQDYEISIRAGDYHSGPLSLILPFGIWGVLGFFWFLYHCTVVLWRNLKNGESQFYRINVFLFSYFIARVVFFFFFFGAFEQDLWNFSAITGVSLCVNRGLKDALLRPRLKYEPAVARRREMEFVGV